MMKRGQKDKWNIKYLKVKDIKSLIIFLFCIGLLIGIPFYWFFLVPPAPELQEINQSSYSVSGYLAPGGYFNLQINLGEQSIQGYHNGELNLIFNITNTQNVSLWNPTDTRVDQWPGSKSEIKYSSNSPINKNMVLIIDKINIPNETGLKGQTVPLNIKYSVNYPAQTDQTEILGGTITNFDMKTDYIEKNISIKLNNQMITQKQLDAINMNESWKKTLSLVIWIIDLLFFMFFCTEIKVIENFKTNSRNLIKKVIDRFKKLI